MSRFNRNHALLLGSSAFIALIAANTTALSQDSSTPTPTGVTALPEVVVSSPSPIRHAQPRPSRTSAGSGPQRQARSRAPVPQAAAPSPPPPPVQGTLPIVTDQFATVTVVPNEEIRRSGATTLGDLLLNKPGITASSFAPVSYTHLDVYKRQPANIAARA